MQVALLNLAVVFKVLVKCSLEKHANFSWLVILFHETHNSLFNFIREWAILEHLNRVSNRNIEIDIALVFQWEINTLENSLLSFYGIKLVLGSFWVMVLCSCSR